VGVWLYFLIWGFVFWSPSSNVHEVLYCQSSPCPRLFISRCVSYVGPWHTICYLEDDITCSAVALSRVLRTALVPYMATLKLQHLTAPKPLFDVLGGGGRGEQTYLLNWGFPTTPQLLFQSLRPLSTNLESHKFKSVKLLEDVPSQQCYAFHVLNQVTKVSVIIK